MAKGKFSPFLWVDTRGVPFEIVHNQWAAQGGNSLWLVLTFTAEALRAGWRKTRVQSELREARMFGIEVPEWLAPSQPIK